jgi:excisionase family DNA binding protein
MPLTEIRGRLLDAREVAERLNMSKPTVYRLINQASLPAVQYGVGGSLRVPEIDLELWLLAMRKDTDA